MEEVHFGSRRNRTKKTAIQNDVGANSILNALNRVDDDDDDFTIVQPQKARLIVDDDDDDTYNTQLKQMVKRLDGASTTKKADTSNIDFIPVKSLVDEGETDVKRVIDETELFAANIKAQPLRNSARRGISTTIETIIKPELNPIVAAAHAAADEVEETPLVKPEAHQVVKQEATQSAENGNVDTEMTAGPAETSAGPALDLGDAEVSFGSLADIMSFLSRTGELDSSKSGKGGAGGDDDEDEIKIIYRDTSSGRELTAKEEWKAMSQRFNGIKQGAKAKERDIMRRWRQKKLTEQTGNSDAKTSTQKALEAQKEKGHGFIKIPTGL